MDDSELTHEQIEGEEDHYSRGYAERRIRAAMLPHKSQLERYATPAMANIIESMIVAALLAGAGEKEAAEGEAPRDETHDSIDAASGLLTPEAQARRAELAAVDRLQLPFAELSEDGEGLNEELVKQVHDLDEGPLHPAVEAANRELARTEPL